MMLKSHNFKTTQAFAEYLSAPIILREVMEDFALLSAKFRITPICTRILGVVEGDSGVHADYRAADFRHQFSGGYLYSKEQKEEILTKINEKWPRTDGKKTIICHSFNGGPEHFHLQIPRDILVFRKI